LYNRKEVAI